MSSRQGCVQAGMFYVSPRRAESTKRNKIFLDYISKAADSTIKKNKSQPVNSSSSSMKFRLY